MSKCTIMFRSPETGNIYTLIEDDLKNYRIPEEVDIQVSGVYEIYIIDVKFDGEDVYIGCIYTSDDGEYFLIEEKEGRNCKGMFNNLAFDEFVECIEQ